MTAPSPGVALDPIIGRGPELDAIRSALGRSRLVTLTGLGGVGKTTLAVAHAASVAEDTVAFVDLAPIADPAAVAGAIGSALGVSDATGDLEAALGERLEAASLTLILDNFEHLLAARDLPRRLLERAPRLRLLVTSRVALDVDGEEELRVETLAVPSSAAEVDTAGAGQLFLRRAREAGALRSLDPADAAAIVDICHRLDGLPLAIELAAAWTRLLSPRAIARRLADERLPLAGEGPGRHATIDEIVRSTLDLLDPRDRDVFERLGLFVGPFDEVDARAVTGVEDVLPVLRRLHAAALLRVASDGDGEPSLRLLETIRTVAAARLGTRPDAVDATRRFIANAAARAQAAADQLRDVTSAGALAWMSEAIPNLRAAQAAAVEMGDAPAAVQLAMTLATHGVRAGSARESLVRLRQSLDVGPVPAGIRSEALTAVANLMVAVNEPGDVVPLLDEAMQLARAAGEPRREVRAMIAFGAYGPPERGVEVLEAALELAERIDYAWAVTAAIDNLAGTHEEAGRWKLALELSERSLALAERAGDEERGGHALASMAELSEQLGREADALDYARAAVERLRASWPSSTTMVWALTVRARAELHAGDRAAAAATIVEATTVARRVEGRAGLRLLFEGAAVILAAEAPDVAARALGASEGLGPAAPTSGVLRPWLAAAAHEAGRRLGPSRLERERIAGRHADPWRVLDAVHDAARSAERARTTLRVEYGSLTPREIDVLRLVAEGRTDPEIADTLGMSAKTASVHVANIKGKLGATTRVDAAIRARDLLGSAR